MLIPNQTIEITIGGRTIKYYKSIGYKDIKSRQKITIPIEDLIESNIEYEIVSRPIIDHDEHYIIKLWNKEA